MKLSDDQFDKIADAELHALESALLVCDPDELEVELSSGVLTLTLADDDKVVINSHRAAGEIWMAAFRNAWHFRPVDESGKTLWRTTKDELRSTLRSLLSEKLGHSVEV